MNQLINVDYSVVTYKKDLEHLYSKIKLLFNEINNINNKKDLLSSLIPIEITNELELRSNKTAIDTISLLFKSLETINNDIKKTLNNWKSNFAGINGLDSKIKLLKDELIQPFKDEQIKYDEYIKNTKTLKEQAETKTTIGIKTYNVIQIDNVDISKLDSKYLTYNESLIKEDIKNNPNIEIKGVSYRIVEIKK